MLAKSYLNIGKLVAANVQLRKQVHKALQNVLALKDKIFSGKQMFHYIINWYLLPYTSFKDGVLIIIDPRKELYLHCKYDTLCLRLWYI